MPPQILALAAIAAGLYAGYRLAVRANEAARAERVKVRTNERASAAGEPRDLGRLEWDDKAGVYRPRQD
ncbi:MAG: hypothetical protein NW205_11300 [Hyphomicrobiaceae bacterium]|nr:hypothetical protein [Hyphomicrobiaceae bacterium]